MNRLHGWGLELAAAFDGPPYLVGSAARAPREYLGCRDIDVRVILEDECFDRLFGPYREPRWRMARWNLVCCALAYDGARRTGLPIDFQIDRQSQANETYPGEIRIAFGVRCDND